MKRNYTIVSAAVLILSLAAALQAKAADLPKLEYAFMAAEIADMATTADIKHHANMWETNKVLGRHPSDAAVWGYGAAMIAVHALITHEMQEHGVSPKLITAWELVTIGYETAYVVHNYSIGLKCRF